LYTKDNLFKKPVSNFSLSFSTFWHFIFFSFFCNLNLIKILIGFVTVYTFFYTNVVPKTYCRIKRRDRALSSSFLETKIQFILKIHIYFQKFIFLCKFKFCIYFKKNPYQYWARNLLKHCIQTKNQGKTGYIGFSSSPMVPVMMRLFLLILICGGSFAEGANCSVEVRF